MTTLIPCGECARHVRSTETACPFCGRAIGATHTRALDPTTRLGRAAMFAFRATTVAALSTLAACGDERAAPPPTSVVPPFDPTIMQPYGAPPLPEPPPSQVPPAPPSTLAPTPTDVPSAPESHARPERPTSMHALYGAAPHGDLGEGSGIPD